jgi:hypothetical protein
MKAQNPRGRPGNTRRLTAEQARELFMDRYNEPALLDPPPLTRRQYLVLTVIEQTGCDVFLAMEAVASTAVEHPEWDMDEKRTFEEWAWDERLRLGVKAGEFDLT